MDGMEIALTGEESDTDVEEIVSIAIPLLDPEGTGRGRAPLENPAVEPITEEMLIAPHPDEPGVLSDGTAHPRENPFGYTRPR
jgi:hypothetical protein